MPARPEITGRAIFDFAAHTISEFCRAHRISRAHYYVLRRRGLGPEETELLGKIIITHESAARWRKQRTAASRKTAA
jgi:hypothetical protein